MPSGNGRSGDPQDTPAELGTHDAEIDFHRHISKVRRGLNLLRSHYADMVQETEDSTCAFNTTMYQENRGPICLRDIPESGRDLLETPPLPILPRREKLMQPAINIRTIETASDRRMFIRYPWNLHAHHPAWVPPLVSEENRFFDPARNHAFSYCDAIMGLAVSGEKPCGRIMGIINHRYTARSGERTARFGYLECPNEPNLAGRLLAFVEEWGRSRGMAKIVGPMGFTDQDPEGYIVDGFEHEPTVATYANFPYMSDLLAACGYGKEIDYVVYKVPVPSHIPAVYQRVVNRITRERHVRTYEFHRRSELKAFAGRILAMMNETFAGLYGYVPLDEQEMALAAKKFLPVVDPRFVNFCTVDGDDAAFILAMPNIDAGVRKANGRLFPFGLLHIMAAARRTRQLDLLVGGVKREHRHHGLTVLGMAMLLRAAREAGMETIDSHLELETNLRMRAEMERMGGVLCKRYRIFQKQL